MQRRRRVVTQAQAGDLFDLKGTVGRRLARGYFQVRADLAQDGFASRLRAAGAGAHADERASGGTIVEHRIEAHDAVDFRLGHAQRLADGRQHGGFQAAI